MPDGESDDESADEGDDTEVADDGEAQASDEAVADDAEDEDDDGELDSTKDAVRVNEPDASAPRDAGTTAVKDAAQSKPDTDVVVDAATPAKDAATVDAGAVATCTAGTYVGTFSIDIGGGLTRDSTFDGTVTLELSGAGDNLKIQTGSLSGKDASGNPLTAKVSGSLNCLTKKLEGGTLSDGVFEQRGLISTIRFSGTMAASFSTESAALQGTWTLESSLRTRSGTGRFTAIKQP